MINSKECQKQFEKIIEGKENEGYIKWRNKVIEQISEVSKENLLNMIKRNEINLKLIEERSEMGELIAQFITIMGVLLPSIATLVISALQIQISSYDNMISSTQAKEFSELVKNIMQDTTNSLLWGLAIFCILIFILYFVATEIDRYFTKKRKKQKTYYEELLVVLKEEFEKKDWNAQIVDQNAESAV